MTSQKTHTPSIVTVYDTTVKSLKRHPALFVPFVIFLICDLISIAALYLAPRAPFIKIFGPPIRTFWGERFLHYPLNFLLLPKLTSLARMGLSVIIGSLLTGVAVAIMYDIYNKKKPKLGSAFGVALKKYLYLFIIVALFTLLFYFLVKLIPKGLVYYFIAGRHKQLLFLGINFWLGPFLLLVNFLLAIFIQAAFIYAIPLLIIEKEKLLKSIWKSFVLFKNLFIPTLILVTLPTLLFVPIVILQQKNAFLVYRVFPEIVLLVSILNAALSALVIDCLMTVSTTVLYLLQKEK